MPCLYRSLLRQFGPMTSSSRPGCTRGDKRERPDGNPGTTEVFPIGTRGAAPSRPMLCRRAAERRLAGSPWRSARAFASPDASVPAAPYPRAPPPADLNEGSGGWLRAHASTLLGGGCAMAAAKVAGGEAGLVQRVAVEPHLTSRPIQVFPEGERQVGVVSDVDEAVEGESQFAVLQERRRGRGCDLRGGPRGGLGLRRGDRGSGSRWPAVLHDQRSWFWCCRRCLPGHAAFAGRPPQRRPFSLRMRPARGAGCRRTRERSFAGTGCVRVGRERVERLMRQVGLAGIKPRQTVIRRCPCPHGPQNRWTQERDRPTFTVVSDRTTVGVHWMRVGTDAADFCKPQAEALNPSERRNHQSGSPT